MIVYMKVERARDKESTVRPQHPVDLLEATPKASDVLEGIHGDHRTERMVRVRQCLHVCDLVHTWSGPCVNSQVRLAGKQHPQIGDLFLTGNLVRTNLEDRPGQVKTLSDGTG